MQKFILRRLIQTVICIIGISIIIFLLSHLSGDPAVLMSPPEATLEDIEKLRVMLGLDKPLHVQYWVFISNAVKGDFGKSILLSRPCLEIWREHFVNTLQLTSVSMAWSLIAGISIGILSAVKVGTWFDNFGKALAIVGQATPGFWLGLMLILVFSVWLGWLPTSRMGGFNHLIMPSVTLGGFFVASIVRITRSAMLDVLDSEYIKLARIKGVPESQVILKHALRNALIPIVTVVSLNLVFMLNGTVVTESVFNWPGVGRLLVESIFARDFPVVQVCVLIGACLYIFINLIVDIVYAYIDPRIRYQ